jgi:hypothetical protein
MISPVENNIIKLDVGGVRYKTSLNTLIQYPESMLANMFSGRHANKSMIDSDGYYFIDRDGAIFNYIIIFLRNGTLDLDDIPKSIIKSILTEADYFNIPNLIELCNKKIGNTISIKNIDLGLGINLDELSKEFNNLFSLEMLQNYNTTKTFAIITCNLEKTMQYKNVDWVMDNCPTYSFSKRFIKISINFPYSVKYNRYATNINLFPQDLDQHLKKILIFIFKLAKIKHEEFVIPKCDEIDSGERHLKSHVNHILNSNLVDHPYNKVYINISNTTTSGGGLYETLYLTYCEVELYIAIN